MMKKKIITLILLLLCSSLLFTGCNSNRKIFSTTEKFTKAIILFNDEVIEVNVKEWSSSYGTVTLYDENGIVYVTSINNILITNK